MSQLPSTGRLKKLNRRQRKKLRMGEFQELVFEAELGFKAPLDNSAYETFIDAFIAFVESRDLLIGGFGGSPPLTETDGLVLSWRPKRVSDADRQAVREWLEQRPEVGKVEVGELFDGWYGWNQAK